MESAMKRNKTYFPQIGEEWDSHQNNQEENARKYADTLRWYRPRGFSKLARELESFANGKDSEFISEIEDDCDTLLTEWAQRVTRNSYIYFGVHESGSVGFWIMIDSAIEDANHIVSDSPRSRNDGPLPRGFTGLYVHISDHGNVSAYNYSRGRMTRELFAVV
jgi:hypothetical protein